MPYDELSDEPLGDELDDDNTLWGTNDLSMIVV